MVDFYRYLPPSYKKQPLVTLIIYAITTIFEDFEADYAQIVASCGVYTAEGFWLDFWGYFFHIKRFIKEVDTDYRERILLTINVGSVTKQAILGIAEPFSRLPSSLIEHNGSTVIGKDYTTYDPDLEYYKRNIMTLTYIPQFISSDQKTFFVGKSFLGVDTYTTKITNRYSIVKIKSIINNIKTAGVKLIHKFG